MTFGLGRIDKVFIVNTQRYSRVEEFLCALDEALDADMVSKRLRVFMSNLCLKPELQPKASASTNGKAQAKSFVRSVHLVLPN